MPWPNATRHLRQGLGLWADRDAHARKSSAMLWIPHCYQVGRITMKIRTNPTNGRTVIVSSLKHSHVKGRVMPIWGLAAFVQKKYRNVLLLFFTNKPLQQ